MARDIAQITVPILYLKRNSLKSHLENHFTDTSAPALAKLLTDKHKLQALGMHGSVVMQCHQTMMIVAGNRLTPAAHVHLAPVMASLESLVLYGCV